MVSSRFQKHWSTNCPDLTKAAMSDKDSNKHGAKNTVLFNGLLYQIFKKRKTKREKKKPHTFWLIVKLDVKDFTL